MTMRTETAARLLSRIEQGALHGSYGDLYGSRYSAAIEDARYRELVQRHQQLFRTVDEVRLYSTPGRTSSGGTIPIIITGTYWLQASTSIP